MPGNTSTFLTLARSDHDLRTRWRPTKADRTGACSPRAQPERPSATVRACANETLQPRAEGAARPPLSRAAARAKPLSRMPGNTSTFLTLARSDHDLRTRWRPTKADRTGACFPRAQPERPSATVRACANETLQSRAEGAARPPLSRAAARAIPLSYPAPPSSLCAADTAARARQAPPWAPWS